MEVDKILERYRSQCEIDRDVMCVGLALASYNESATSDIILSLLPGYQFHAYSFDRGAQYFYVVRNDRLGLACVICRGTDGFTPFGRFRSWLTDARVITGPDGVPNGFQHYGDRCFDRIKDLLENYDYLYFGCHSQGSGYGQYVARLCCDNLTLKHVRCNFLAYPPCFNSVGVIPFNEYVRTGKISANLISTSGDPMTSSFWREENSLFRDGVDIDAEVIVLPDILKQDDGRARLYKKVLSLLNHSPSQYLPAYILWRLLRDECNPADLRFLSLISRYLVN